MNPPRIAIFASGNGTNAEEIIRYFSGRNVAEIVLLLSNNPDAGALGRAKRHGIPGLVFNREEFRESGKVLEWLNDYRVTHVVLAGFLWLLPASLIRAFPDRIINIHPALLPSFGGKGMYGMKVHEAVRKSGDAETGITIHLVNERYDEGRILFQARCRVERDFTAEDIARAVHDLEYRHYPEVIERWVLGRI